MVLLGLVDGVLVIVWCVVSGVSVTEVAVTVTVCGVDDFLA